jgi:hypothetical protein
VYRRRNDQREEGRHAGRNPRAGRAAPKGPIRELVRNVTDSVDRPGVKKNRPLLNLLKINSDGAGKHRIGTPVRDLVKKVLGGGDDDEKSGPPKADDDPE